MLEYSDVANKILDIIDEDIKCSRFTVISDLSNLIKELVDDITDDYNEQIAEYEDRINDLEYELDEVYDDLHDAETELEKYEEDN